MILLNSLLSSSSHSSRTQTDPPISREKPVRECNFHIWPTCTNSSSFKGLLGLIPFLAKERRSYLTSLRNRVI